MANIGIMIEGQEDLTWERFFRISEAVEALGFECLFRSDHLTALNGFSKRESLALWPSLTALALKTSRIKFGAMVSPITFRHPSMMAKMAASVSTLSKGRLEVGLGAGWFKDEHRMFGIYYPPYSTRLEMLDEATTVIKALWSGEPVTFKGKYYQLDEAETYSLPFEGRPNIIMGGKGKKTLGLVAKYADEWNCAYFGVEAFREKSRELDEACLAIGRDPASLRRSLMTPFIIGKDEIAQQNRVKAHNRTFPDLPTTLKDWLSAGFVGGSGAQLIDQLGAFVEAGVDRFTLQHNDLDDLDSLELLADSVLAHF